MVVNVQIFLDDDVVTGVGQKFGLGAYKMLVMVEITLS